MIFLNICPCVYIGEKGPLRLITGPIRGRCFSGNSRMHPSASLNQSSAQPCKIYLPVSGGSETKCLMSFWSQQEACFWNPWQFHSKANLLSSSQVGRPCHSLGATPPHTLVWTHFRGIVGKIQWHLPPFQRLPGAFSTFSPVIAEWLSLYTFWLSTN